MSTVEITLLNHQGEFIFSRDTNPAIIGGLGSGKTKAGTGRLVKLMLEDPDADTMYLMPTFDLLNLRAISGFIEDLEEAKLKYTVNRSTMIISIKGRGNIYLRSYDNPSRIIAFEVAHVVVDEIDTINKEKASLVWRKVTERVRQSTPYMILNNIKNSIGCVTTPDQGVTGFVYEKWGKNPSKGYVLIKASTYDNPYLPEGYTDQILENYDSILADLYMRGEFVSLNQNKVYWSFNRFENHSDEVLDKDFNGYIYYSQDFNVGGNVSILFKIIGKTVHVVREVETMTTQEIPVKLSHLYPNAKFICCPDASGGNESANAPKSSLNILKDSGHRIDAPKANPSIRDRVNAVNAMLSHKRLFINTIQCPNLTNALEVQGYDKKGKPEKSDEHPAPDDYNDALGYYVHRKHPIKRPTIIAHNRR